MFSKRHVYHLVAAEISTLTRYCDEVIQWMRRPEDSGDLFDEIAAPAKSSLAQGDALPSRVGTSSAAIAILLNGVFNHHADIQQLLEDLAPRLSRRARLVVVLYNPYLGWLYRLAHRIGLRKGPEPTTFVTTTDLRNLARLAGYRVVRIRPSVCFPYKLFGLGTLLNSLLVAVPGWRRLALVHVVILRRVRREDAGARPTLSIVIPARNEAGTIRSALERLPDFGVRVEALFVEGHSTDDTWPEIQRLAAEYREHPSISVRAFQQTGRGKADAVRLGFAQATGDVLTILDADLSTPPEILGRFYSAYCDGLADFVNGTRLVYPMEDRAMRFMNRLGNVFFAKAVGAALDVRIGDSLCGTKLLARADYERSVAWRRDFGDFDPFGDFELLYPAAVLALDIVDVPVPYRARTYGQTNIHRFRDGLLLLRMVALGWLRVRMGRW